jgi:hypothetical protein
MDGDVKGTIIITLTDKQREYIIRIYELHLAAWREALKEIRHGDDQG